MEYAKILWSRAAFFLKGELYKIGLGVLLFALLLGVLLMAVGLLLYGTITGLALLMGNRLWLSSLATSLFIILLIGIYFQWKIRSLRKKSKSEKLVQKQKEDETELENLWQELARTADLINLTQEHPWKATGAAALIGFAAAQPFFFSMLMSTGTELFKEFIPPFILQQIRSSLHPPESPSTAA